MGRIKEAFKHFTAIPFHLKDKKLDLKEANDWQAYHLEGRANNMSNKTYAWTLFNVKYVWDVATSKWVERSLGKQLSSTSRDLVLKNTLDLLRERRNKNYANFTALIDSMIGDLQRLRHGICEVEIEMAELECRPQRLEQPKKGKEEKVEADVENESKDPADAKVEK